MRGLSYLWEQNKSDEEVLNYLCDKDKLTPDEEKLLEQLMIEEDAKAGYFEED